MSTSKPAASSIRDNELPNITRRQALLGGSSALVLQTACSTVGGTQAEAGPVFAHGVASGDPETTSVVLWTRVSELGGSVRVGWKIASDRNFDDVVDSGRFETHAGRDYTVNVVASNLSPGHHYYYQFSVAGEKSPLGRTKTLPVGSLERLVIAVASCSNYPFGYFNAYEHIANDADIDVVAHLGDYIYEYDENGYGGEAGRRLDRVHEPRHETVSLSDYRIRHAQYKSDSGSQAMHANHPLIVIWDDHESANNPWMGGAQNHQPEEGEWTDRRTASLTAYYEWMPIRPPARGDSMIDFWRHYKFGDLVSLITLESRHTGRSEQVAYGDLSRFENSDAAQAFYQRTAGAADRNFLSAPMERFLAAELNESVTSGQRWRIIGNQSVIAKSVSPDIDHSLFHRIQPTLPEFERRLMANLTQMGRLGIADDLDSWNGYPAARERFYQLAKNAGARDLLVLSGDSHSFWANTLHDDSGDNVGVELGTTGITSPRSLRALGTRALQRFDELFVQTNAEILWANGQYNGYIRLDINDEEARAEFIAVSNIESRQFGTEVVHAARIVNDGQTLRYI